MPIRPENRDRYPADWPEISLRIRTERAQGRCECVGQCGRPARHLADDGRCRNRNGQPAYLGGQPAVAQLVFEDVPLAGELEGATVVLTVAHLNHQPEDCRDENLAAMCQGCHLHYDRAHHAETRQRTRTAELGRQMDPLF